MGAGAIHAAADARRLARRRLPWMVFDYIDGAAGAEVGLARNRAAMDAAVLPTRVLRNVAQRSLAHRVFGQATGRPWGIAPMAMCNLAAPGADLMLARLAARERVPVCVSTMSSTPMEDIAAAAGGWAWFQLYFSGDGTGTFKLVDRARAVGFDTLILTVDVPELGRRPRELRHGFRMPFRIGPRQFLDFACHPRWSLATLAHGAPEPANFRKPGYAFNRTESRGLADWDTLARLRDTWRGRLVIKGVLDVDDARRLIDAGVDAVQVSSHGSRQLDAAPSPFERLPAIRDGLGTADVFYDSGIRSGEDVLRALRAGADFTFLGRILLYAIAAGGQEGLHRLWHVLSEEASVAMAMMGATDVGGVRPLA